MEVPSCWGYQHSGLQFILSPLPAWVSLWWKVKTKWFNTFVTRPADIYWTLALISYCKITQFNQSDFLNIYLYILFFWHISVFTYLSISYMIRVYFWIFHCRCNTFVTNCDHHIAHYQRQYQHSLPALPSDKQETNRVKLLSQIAMCAVYKYVGACRGTVAARFQTRVSAAVSGGLFMRKALRKTPDSGYLWSTQCPKASYWWRL